MVNCKYLKIKFDRTFECKKSKKKITPKDCANCLFKEYKCITYSQNCAKKEYKSNGNQIRNSTDNKSFKQHKTVKIESKSNKLARLERNRKSLFTDDLDHCIICKRKREHLHEVFPGRNRTNSMKYNLVLPLCSTHHRLMHSNTKMMYFYKEKGQALFEKAYPDLDFVDIFKRNYK